MQISNEGGDLRRILGNMPPPQDALELHSILVEDLWLKMIHTSFKKLMKVHIDKKLQVQNNQVHLFNNPPFIENLKIFGVVLRPNK